MNAAGANTMFGSRPALWCLAAVAALATAAIGAELTVRDEPLALATNEAVTDGELALAAAANRATVVRTTSCGDTSRSFGSGLIVGPGRVLTAAHVVAGAGSVSIEIDSWSADAKVSGYDTKRDLALLDIEAELPVAVKGDVSFGQLQVGERGRLVDAATSGSMPLVIVDRTTIETDDVREPSRSRRAGYVIDASTQAGDSGAGVYTLDGDLAGIVFAASTVTEGRSFVTSSSEIEDFLVEQNEGAAYRCDPDISKLVVEQ